MSRSLPRTIVVLVAMLALVAAGCGGSSSSKTAGKTVVAPIRSFTDGPATASVKAGDQAIEYKGGTCEKGAGDKYLALNIGDTNGSGDYFGLLAGQSPSADTSAHSANGGGDLSGEGEALVTFRHASRSYLLRFTDTKITLAANIASGSFTSTLTTPDATGATTTVSGTFHC